MLHISHSMCHTPPPSPLLAVKTLEAFVEMQVSGAFVVIYVAKHHATTGLMCMELLATFTTSVCDRLQQNDMAPALSPLGRCGESSQCDQTTWTPWLFICCTPVSTSQ